MANGNHHFLPGDGKLEMDRFLSNLKHSELWYLVLEIDAKKNYGSASPGKLLERARRYFASFIKVEELSCQTR